MGSSTSLIIGEIIIPDHTSLAPVWVDSKLDWINFAVYNRSIKINERSFFTRLVLNYELDDQIEIILPNGLVGISLSSYWKSA